MKVLAWGVFGIAWFAIGLAALALIFMPWIKLLTGGAGRNHSVWSFYWTVSPSPVWLAVRAGAVGAAVLFFVFSPASWGERALDALPFGTSRADKAQAGPSEGGQEPAETAPPPPPAAQPGAGAEEPRGATPAADGPAGPREDTADTTDREEMLFALMPTLSIIGLALILMVGVFASTDYQAALNHPAGPLQCFSVGLQRPNGSVDGVLHVWDALYFTTGNLATAGTGLVLPLSRACRAVVSVQTAIGAAVILLGVGGLLTRLLAHPLFRPPSGPTPTTTSS